MERLFQRKERSIFVIIVEHLKKIAKTHWLVFPFADSFNPRRNHDFESHVTECLAKNIFHSWCSFTPSFVVYKLFMRNRYTLIN